MINDTAKALTSLLGDAEWSITDDDLSTLVIYTKGVAAPTQSEIDAEIARMAQEKIDSIAAKAALLERLGITQDEAALLLK